MTTRLPSDVARCLVRRDWTADTEICEVRNTCRRYLAAADGEFGPRGQCSWYLWMCEMSLHEQRRPVEGGAA